MPEFVAFLSYARINDRDGRLSWLKESLERAVQEWTGDHTFRIFQDVRDVRWGQQGSNTILEALGEVFVIIPIMTPSYFKSEWCRREYEQFVERESYLRRKDLILPIYWLTCDLQNESARLGNPWAQGLWNHQWKDWRPLRTAQLGSPETLRFVEDLAEQIKKVLDTVTPRNIIRESGDKITKKLIAASRPRMPARVSPSVSLSPETAVPGFPIRISLTGFTPESFVAVGGISIGGAAWNAAVIHLSASGDSPIVMLNAPMAMQPGAYQVVVTDADGVFGVVRIVVPQRIITISPLTSARGSTVRVIGIGYTRNGLVMVNYITGVALSGRPVGGVIGTATALADANGNFTADLIVPPIATINSTNIIHAVDNTSAIVPAPTNGNTVTHTVPGPVLTVLPLVAVVGGTITILGTGFPALSAVIALTVGGMGSLPPNPVTTDDQGSFLVSVIVPGQPTGDAAVVATVGSRASNITGVVNIRVAKSVQ